VRTTYFFGGGTLARPPGCGCGNSGSPENAIERGGIGDSARDARVDRKEIMSKEPKKPKKEEPKASNTANFRAEAAKDKKPAPPPVKKGGLNPAPKPIGKSSSKGK